MRLLSSKTVGDGVAILTYLPGNTEVSPGTTNYFGGGSTAEYGPLLKTVYAEQGFTTVAVYNNFNSGDRPNPCPVR